MVDHLITGIPLKDMDPALLAQAVRAHATAVGHNGDDIEKAIALAAYVHRDQVRNNRGELPKTPYIEHPLRNAARLYRWGVTDQAMIIAEILHDTVEDGAHAIAVDICRASDDVSTAAAREVALEHITAEFGPVVGEIVARMTNPLYPSGRTVTEKHEQYRADVRRECEDPRVAVNKFADFADNGVGLHHNDTGVNDSKIEELAAKYYPLIPYWWERLARNDVAALISADGWQSMRNNLATAELELGRILARSE